MLLTVVALSAVAAKTLQRKSLAVTELPAPRQPVVAETLPTEVEDTPSAHRVKPSPVPRARAQWTPSVVSGEGRHAAHDQEERDDQSTTG